MHDTVLLDILWYMLMKFSKQIANTFAKIINDYDEMGLFPQVVTGFRGEFKILHNYLRLSFLQKQSKIKVVYCFCKNLHFQYLIRF